MKGFGFILKEKTQNWFSYFRIAHKYHESFLTDPSNMSLDDVDI